MPDHTQRNMHNTLRAQRAKRLRAKPSQVFFERFNRGIRAFGGVRTLFDPDACKTGRELRLQVQKQL
jgi:hypothetical protein